MRKLFKELTLEDKEYIKLVYYKDITHKEKTDILGKKFGIKERTVRHWWQKMSLGKLPSDLPPQLQKAQERSLHKNTKVILISTVQNKTSINSDMWREMKAYREFAENDLGKQAEIVLIPSKYRNPTSNVEDEKAKASDWWEDEIEDYLFYGNIEFGDCTISADSRISPTAKEPLNGFELLTDSGHLVLGHSKIHFKTLPRLRKEPLRTMCTTGYLSTKNYSKSKSGAIGYAHHSYGFVVVELKEDNTCYIPRNVKVKSDGSFIDIVYEVKNGVVSKIESSSGLVWGDIHQRQLDTQLVSVTKELINNYLKPKKHVLHDVLDASTINHHEAKDMFLQRLKITEGKHLLEDEINEALDFIGDLSDCCGEVYVIESNHDNFLDRHINEAQWKRDLHNSPAYLKYALIQQTTDLREHGNIFGYLIHEKFKGDVKYVKMGDSMYIESYQVGLHGDFGNAGSRATARSFSRLNMKLIHGHSHSPVLHNNVVCVGVTCKLEQHYNRKGLSSWAHAHCVIHENGKNQLLVFGDDYNLSGLIDLKYVPF